MHQAGRFLKSGRLTDSATPKHPGCSAAAGVLATNQAPARGHCAMTDRVYNFSPGPAMLPLKVLEEAQRDLLALPGLGISALEISHRSKWFDGVLEETTANL